MCHNMYLYLIVIDNKYFSGIINIYLKFEIIETIIFETYVIDTCFVIRNSHHSVYNIGLFFLLVLLINDIVFMTL